MASGASREQLADRVAALLAPVVSAAGADLEKVEITPAGRRRVVRVVIDCDGGIGLDEVTAASHAISAALDSGDALGPAPYVLEVTSPGVDRPLTAARHWHRARGRLVRVALLDGNAVLGRVLGVGEAEVSLEVAGTTRTIAYAEVADARVEVEFSRDEAPAAGGEEAD